jgi:hypothetical protein
MALSNYDCLAFDTEGFPCDGYMKIPHGTTVEIYKNWLYVGNEKMWVEGGSFVSPVIAQVSSGHINIARLDISSERHDEQNSIFCYIESNEYFYNEGKKFAGSKKHVMCGIGCSGYLNTHVWMKKHHPEVMSKMLRHHNLTEEEFFNGDVWEYSSGNDDWGWEYFVDGEDSKNQIMIRISMKELGKSLDQKIPKPDIRDLWVGVLQETLDAFIKWLKDVAPKEYFEKIDFENCRRVNQGDAYFSNVEDTEYPSTPIGESSTPAIIDKIENTFNKLE